MRIIGLSMGILLLVCEPVYGDAPNPLRALAESTGRDGKSLVRLGDLYVEAMSFKEARQAYRYAVKIGDKDGEAALGMARIKIARGQFSEVKRACQLIANGFPKKTVGEVCFGWFWLSKDRSARAILEFEKATKKGDLTRGKTGMGEALRKRGEYAESIAAFGEAIGAGAGYRAFLGRGLVEEVKGDKKAAALSLKKAVTMEPASCLAHFHYGRLLKPGDEAIEHLELALEMRPSWTEAGMALGKTYLALKQYEKAMGAFNGTLSEQAGRGEAYFGLGRALLGMGKNKEARDALKKTVELIPNHKRAFLLLAEIQFEAGNGQAVADALEQARKAAPGDMDVYVTSGEMFYKLGRLTSARSFLVQAVSMNSNISKAHAILGHIACRRRLYSSGLEHYDTALKGDMVGVNGKDIEEYRRECKPKPKGK